MQRPNGPNGQQQIAKVVQEYLKLKNDTDEGTKALKRLKKRMGELKCDIMEYMKRNSIDKFKLGDGQHAICLRTRSDLRITQQPQKVVVDV